MALSLGGVRVIDRSSDPEANDESYCFAVLNRNRRASRSGSGIRDKEIFVERAAKADIVSGESRPGVATKLGTDREAIA
jgi:crotonobetainyl-CoA:carnitine CoA-transferase CaiB-like acyl-CoA transferase